MKKKLYFFCFMFISITGFGQVIPKGTRFIGGDLGINYSDSKVSGNTISNSTQLSLTPSFTKFTKDNTAIFYSLGYGVTINNFKTSLNSEFFKSYGHVISASLYFRNYKMLSEKLGISVQYGGNLIYSLSTTAVTQTQNESMSSLILNLNVGPGIIYLLNERFAIEGNTSIINLRTTYSWLSDNSSFSIGTNLSGNPGLGFGFRYFLK